MLFSTDYFTAMAKKNKYAAGSLDSIADGALLNQRDVAQILGLTAPTAGKLIKENNFKIIRLTSGRTSPVFIYAGELKRFLEKGGAAIVEPTQSTITTQAVELPPSAVILQAVASEPPKAPPPKSDLQSAAEAIHAWTNRPDNKNPPHYKRKKRVLGYGSK